MWSIRNVLLLLAALLANISGAAEIRTRPFAGITLVSRSETVPRPLKMNIVLIDLSVPGITFKLTSPAGSRDTVRQTTLEFLDQEQAQVAVNVHFFVPFPSAETNVDVVGLAVSRGVAYSPFEPQPVKPDLADQSFAIVPYAPALNIDSSNRVTVVHRDPAQEDNFHVLEPVALWNAFSGSAQIVSSGANSVPRYSGPPDGLKPTGVYTDAHSWYSLPRARTAAGVTADGRTLVLLTVDQAGDSEGMTVDEVADLLIRDYAIANALNLDGGGSTTLVVQDPKTGLGRMVNKSSDNPKGRAVGSSLAVFALPADATTERTLR